MMLVITIALSNGGEVTYEMSDEYYSQRIQFVDSEMIRRDLLTVHAFDSEFIYEILKADDEVRVFKRPLLPTITQWSGEQKFQDSLTPFSVDGYEGLEQVGVTSGVKTGHFYIYIKELNELYPDGKISKVAPVINEDYILAFSDVTNHENDFLTRPIAVKVEWKDSFSPFLSTSIEQLKDRKD